MALIINRKVNEKVLIYKGDELIGTIIVYRIQKPYGPNSGRVKLGFESDIEAGVKFLREEIAEEQYDDYMESQIDPL